MARLFTPLIEDHGVTIVTTSNRPPRDLYKDGLNRSLFVPFIELVERSLDTLSLNGPTDYRMDRLGGLESWHTPLGEAATAQVREAFFRLTDFDPDDASEFWHLVNKQDWDICERVQKGMSSKAFKFGYYAPMEDESLDIRKYIQDRLGIKL